MSQWVHPISISSPREEVAARFVRIHADSLPDPLWHFEIALPKTAQIAPQPAVTPGTDGQLISLSLFHIPTPPADIEVYGLHLHLELDPAEFVDLWMAKTGIAAQSVKRIPSIGGIVGDAVVTWGENREFAGRCFCLKFGARLILLWCRCAATDYPALAETFFMAISTFRMTQDTGQLAQRVHWVEGRVPVPWRLEVPENWIVKEEPGHSELASFQAGWTQQEGGALQGKLTCAIIAAERASTMDEAYGHAQEAAKSSGITLEAATKTQEQPPVGSLSAASWTSPAVVNNQQAEFRVRVVRHDKCWVIVGMVSPPRAATPAIWMHNMRTLDIITSTLEVK